MIHVCGGAADVAELPGGLPEARRLQSASVARVLDDLGNYLTSHCALLAGPIENDQRTSFLTGRVTRWLMDQLDDTVRALSGGGLLEKLAALDEALASETAREPAQLRARLACFGTKDDEVLRLQNHQSKAVASSLASHFLAEYVTALAPSGHLPLTNETYDHMLHTDEFCRRQREAALENFDLNMAFFAQIPQESFEEALVEMLRKNTRLRPVTDLKSLDGDVGVYVLLLDDYRQAYIGQSWDMHKRIQSPLERDQAVLPAAVGRCRGVRYVDRLVPCLGHDTDFRLAHHQLRHPGGASHADVPARLPAQPHWRRRGHRAARDVHLCRDEAQEPLHHRH